MPSGKRRRALPDTSRTGGGALALILLAAGLLASCGSGARFERALDKLEAGPRDAAGLERLLGSAARRAESSRDWLRLISRAFRAAEQAGDPGLAAGIADRARKAYPTYEDIALAACRAYLDAGRPGDALALFPVPLDPGLRGPWFAEAFLETSRLSGRRFPGAGDAEALLRVAQSAGRGEPAIDAALLRMGAGDREGAAWLTRKAVELGAAPDPDLAWDVGALSTLLSDPARSTYGGDLQRKADAAALLGEREWAREYLTELVLADPGFSWKAYAALASLEADRTGAEYWYGRMAESFPSDPDALRSRAAYLSRTGRDEQALAELEAPGGGTVDPRTAVLAAEIRMRLRPGESRAVTALGLANAFPEDAYVQEWALGTLAAADRFEEAAEAYRQLKVRGMDLGRPWYFEALSLILEGKNVDAAALIERDGPAGGGPEAPFALGVLYSEEGNHSLAAERFHIAAGAAKDAETAARALTEMGKSLAALGERRRAREAWAAALAVRPDHTEALRLLTGR